MDTYMTLGIRPKPRVPESYSGVGGMLKAAASLVHSTGLLYREIRVALPEFTVPLDKGLRLLDESILEGIGRVQKGLKLPPGTQQMFQQLSPVLCDVSRHIFTMATSDASMESYMLPDNLQSTRIKMRLRELNQLVKDLSEALFSDDKRRSSMSQASPENATNYWELLFGDKEEVKLKELYKTISDVMGREPRCPIDKLAAFFSCDIIDPMNFDRFTTLLEANSVHTANDKLLMGTSSSVSQFLKSQIRIGHLREAISQGDTNEPIRPLDARSRTNSNDSLTSPRLALSPRNENGDIPLTSRTSSQSNHTDSSWLRMKVENWFREVDRIYRFFHGDIPHDDAEAILRGHSPGTFLLCYSATNPSRLCVSMVFSAPIGDNSWKDKARMRDVIIHHELLCTCTKEPMSPREGDDILRSFTSHDTSPRRERKAAVDGRRAFAALHQVIKSGTLLEECLRPPATRLPGIPGIPGIPGR